MIKGIPVYIDNGFVEEMGRHIKQKPNGIALTDSELEQFAREAFEAGKEAATYGIMQLRWAVQWTIDKPPPLHSDDYWQEKKKEIEK